MPKQPTPVVPFAGLIIVLATIVGVGLKLGGFIDLSWFYVFLPIFVAAAMALFALVLAGVMMFLIILVGLIIGVVECVQLRLLERTLRKTEK